MFRLPAYIRLLRPAEWIKNVFVFAALAFGNKLADPHARWLSILAFIVFCLASSAGYIFNDILDRERDRHHPIKKNRALASGDVRLETAAVIMSLLLVMAASISYLALPLRLVWTVSSYVALTLIYSVVLKHHMLVDVIAIAILFVLRAVGGAVAIQVTVSPWLLVCTFMLCLFMGFGKRRCEIATISNSDSIRGHRATLLRYTPDLLNQLLSTSGGITIITFLLYTLDKSTDSPFKDNKHQLLYTLPLVVYGIYRYAMLIELGKATGPTDLVIHDRPFLYTILLWAAAAVIILYRGLPAGF